MLTAPVAGWMDITQNISAADALLLLLLLLEAEDAAAAVLYRQASAAAQICCCRVGYAAARGCADKWVKG